MTTKKTFLTLLLAAMIFVPFTAGAQVTIGSEHSPSPWSLLDLCTREQQKALHNARMTTEQRNNLMCYSDVNVHSLEDQRKAQGLLIFNICEDCLEYWNGEQWISLCYDRQGPLEQGNPSYDWVPLYGNHTFSLPAATGGVGTITYQWYSSPDGVNNWTPVATNGTSAHLTIPKFIEGSHRWFRRAATDGITTETTAAAEITVFALRNLDYPGTFAANPQDVGRLWQWGTIDGVSGHFSAVTPAGTPPGWNNSNSRDAWTDATDPCPQPYWRVPTHIEFQRLRGHDGSRTFRNILVADWNNTGVSGRLFGGAGWGPYAVRSPENQLFLPFTPTRVHLTAPGQLRNDGGGNYWGRDIHPHMGNSPTLFHISNINVAVWSNTTPQSAFSIRCVLR